MATGESRACDGDQPIAEVTAALLNCVDGLLIPLELLISTRGRLTPRSAAVLLVSAISMDDFLSALCSSARLAAAWKLRYRMTPVRTGKPMQYTNITGHAARMAVSRWAPS